LKLTVIAILGMWLGSGALVWSGTPGTAPSQLKVAATIFPLYDLVRNVAGSVVEVVLLVPPGASPHTFAAKPGTIRALAGSAAIFAIGHGLDDWSTRLARDVGVTRTLVVDHQIPLRSWGPEARTTPDPHYWLAIPNAIRIVQTIARALGDLDPANRDGYVQRAVAYQEQLEAVDQDIRQLFADLPQRNIATFHPAFGYFAEAYKLRVVATFAPSPGQEPTPRHVKQFLHQIKAHRLHVLFVEPQLPRNPLYSLARDLGVTLKQLDPVGGGEGRDSYIAMMRFNAAQIVASFRE
jgi:ABC-type Zn uptake system ZnuABC Zn-binding protein ZnuA